MTDFEVIQGGLSEDPKPSISPKEELSTIRNLKLFMRALEADMASVNQQAQKLKWIQLVREVDQTHKSVLQVLRTIKRAEKKGISGSGPLNKKPDIKLIYDKNKVEERK